MKPEDMDSVVQDKGVHLEPVMFALIARIGGEKLPYDICIVVVEEMPFWLRPLAALLRFMLRLSRVESCELKALDKEPTLSQWKKLNAALKERGIKYVVFERMKVARHAKKL